MTPGQTSKLNYWARGTVPGMMSLVLLFISVLPLGLPHFGPVTPILTLAAVYYWAIYRPDLMPAGLAFALGLLHDILTGGPPGLTALVLLFVCGACGTQRRAVVGKSFMIGWIGFVLIAAVAYFVAWLLACLYYLHPLELTPIAGQFLVSVLLYPPVAHVFSLTQGWIVKAAP